MFAKKTSSYIFLAVLFLTPAVSVLAVTPYEIITYAATNTCKSGATLNGYVNPFFSTDTTRWFEWGASEGSLSNQTVATRNGSNTEYFAQDIHNLAPDTMYYFRAVAQNSKGLARGTVFSFKTVGSVPCPASAVVPAPAVNTTTSGVYVNTNTYASQSVITKPATSIIDTSAILNAVALPVASTQTSGWFEWGSTPDLGYTSIRRYLGTGTTLPLSEVLSGLTPGTTYFFKPVIQNENSTFEGALFSFHTTGMTPATTPVSGVQNSASAINSIAVTTKKPAPAKTEPKPAIVSVSGEQAVKAEVIPSVDTAAPKERVSETIHVENTTNTTLKEVAVRVVLPCSAVYVPTTGGDAFVQTGTMLTHKVGNLKPKEKISLLLWVDVGAGVADKTPIETIAVVDWVDTTHPSGAEVVGRATVTVDKNKITEGNVAAAGAAKGSNSIFPKSLRDWGSVIGIMFLLFAAYMVFLVMRRKEPSPDEGVLEATPALGGTQYTVPGLHAVGVPHRQYISSDPFVTDTNREKVKTITPVVPMKKPVTEKGAPPENLPI